MAVPFAFPSAMNGISCYSISSSVFGVVSYSDISHSNRWVVIFQCCFNLHFPDDIMLGIFDMIVCHLYIFFGEVSVNAFGPFSFSFLAAPWDMKFPEPGISSEPQLWHMPWLWQCWMLWPTTLGHRSNLHPGAAEMPLIPLCHCGNSMAHFKLGCLFSYCWGLKGICIFWIIVLCQIYIFCKYFLPVSELLSYSW